jgi:calcineurin-like phosphoesterase family protein
MRSVGCYTISSQIWTGYEKEKSKVNLSLCITKYHAMKTYGGMEVRFHDSYLRHQIEVSGHLHALAAIPQGKESPVPIG